MSDNSRENQKEDYSNDRCNPIAGRKNHKADRRGLGVATEKHLETVGKENFGAAGEENPCSTEQEPYTSPPVNYQYKARLFEMIFSEKRELLELYNAVNESSYTDPDLLEVNTLKNAVYMAMKNDISFLFDTTSLNLYEHQSTWNPNMPLRDLEYISALYSGLIKDENLFGRRLIKIPASRFYVFYNGIDEIPDRMILKLSDAFMTQEPHASLELETVLLNVNRGHNRKLMSACRTLRDYAEYTARVRTYAAQLPTREAVEKAVTECIREGILSPFLSRHRAEVIAVSIFEYDQEAHMRMEREENFADGYAKGEEDGRETASREAMDKLVLYLIGQNPDLSPAEAKKLAGNILG